MKPNNLVFDIDGHLKLVDFTKAKLYEKTEKNKDHYDRIKSVLMEYEKRYMISQSMDIDYDEYPEDKGINDKNILLGSGIYTPPESIINGYSDYETDYWSFGRLCI